MARTLKLVGHDQKPLEDFDWFWAEYPRKKSKGDAFKAWQQTTAIRPDTEELIAAIERNLASGRWRERNMASSLGVER
jgi:hypothetical protein